MRWVEMHDWPACENPATDTFLADGRDVGTRLDDQRRVVAELEADLLAGGAGADAPTDFGRTGERDERDVGVIDDRVADGAAAAGHDVEVAGGQAALVEQQARERDCRQRSLARGLQHHRATGCDRGRELVRDEVEREVERADRADHTDRHAQGERELPFAGRARVHRHHLAAQRAGRDRREREGGHRALRFDARRS